MATNAAAAGGQSGIVNFPPRGVEIQGNQTASKFCDVGRQQFHALANYFDALAVALEADLTQMLRDNGLDGQASIAGINLGSSDARKAAKKAVRPLRTIAAECHNLSKNWTMLDDALKREVFDVVEAAIRAQEKAKSGGGLKIGA